ncbi:MAG TPA: hypothetical protein EYP34_12645 [Chromatiaceae bacterium]|nr:hypothetical protein [Chromatiaceae bacterium]
MSTTNMTRNNPFNQSGFSLLSLMIAMAIGIFLIGAVMKIYLDSKQSFNARNVVAEVSENQRFALDDMRRILVMAGRDIREIEENDANNSNFHTFPDVSTNATTAAANGAEAIFDGGSNASDIVAVRYRAGPSCGAYQNVPVEGKAQTRSNGTPYRDNKTCRPTTTTFKVIDNELVCESNRYYTRTAATGETTCLTAPSTVRTVLVSGVELMKVLYGVDDNVEPGYASRYLTASEITDWRRVVTLRFALLMGSESDLPRSMRKHTAGTIDILGMEYNEPDTEHLYRVASATLSLRNFNTIVQRQ